MACRHTLDLGRNMIIGYDYPDWPSFCSAWRWGLGGGGRDKGERPCIAFKGYQRESEIETNTRLSVGSHVPGPYINRAWVGEVRCHLASSWPRPASQGRSQQEKDHVMFRTTS